MFSGRFARTSGATSCNTRESWQDFLGRLSLEARDRHLGVRDYERSAARTDVRNRLYERDFVMRLGTLCVRVVETRQQAFLLAGLRRLAGCGKPPCVPLSPLVNKSK
ncbi:MAG: transposase [Nitrospira sp.]|nr:transposase [Nitrospira sp.]